MRVEGDRIYKLPVDKQGRELAVWEAAWYQKIKEEKFENIPVIYEYEPLCMEYIDGRNIYEYDSISYEEKKGILEQVIGCLRQVHGLESIPSDQESYRIAYLDKTYERLKKVRRLVPFGDDEAVVVNGRRCRNIFYCQDVVERLVMEYRGFRMRT